VSNDFVSDDPDSPAAMDTQSGRVVVWNTKSRSTWTLDVCSNTWQAMKPAQEPDSAVGRMVYDSALDVTIAFTHPIYEPGRRVSVWTYLFETNTWTKLPASAPGPRIWPYVRDLVYDSRSGTALFFLEDATLWAYDLTRNAWTKANQTGQVPGERDLHDEHTDNQFYPSFLSYDSVAGRVVLALVGGGTWTFDPLAGVWTKAKAVTPRIDVGYYAAGSEVTFNAVHKRTVIYSYGRLATYDAAAQTRTTVPPRQLPDSAPLMTGPLARLHHTLVYDPINKRVLMFGGQSQMPAGWQSLDDVWAYDLTSRTWAQVVPATRK